MTPINIIYLQYQDMILQYHIIHFQGIIFAPLTKNSEPETYMSLAYLITTNLESSKELSPMRLKMLQVIDRLKNCMEDELIYPRELVAKV